MNVKVFVLIIFSIALSGKNCHEIHSALDIASPLSGQTTDSVIQDSISIKKEIGKFLKGIGKLYAAFNKTVENNDSISNSAETTPSSSELVVPKKRKEVFGFHPYWYDGTQKHYRYDLLSSVSYFACKLNPHTGEMNEEWYWGTTELVDLAQKNNTKVYLTIVNFTTATSPNNQIFFDNKEAQQTSLETISQLLKKRNAAGVIIDFEGVPAKSKEAYTSYIKALYDRLKQDKREVIITLPGNLTESFNIIKLRDYVTYFIVMGKNYYFSGSTYAGPVAPLNSGVKWNAGSLKNSVKSYVDNGLPKNKLILSLPYYGSQWKIADTILPSKILKFVEHLSYKRIKEKFKKQPQYDNESQSAYLNYPDKNGKTYTQVWYDNAKSLGAKYDFINDNDLAGVGIWALGYDDGYEELWNVLEEKFNPKKPPLPNENTELSWISLFKDSNIIQALLILVFIVVIFGFMLSLRNNEVRDIVFQKTWIKNSVLFGIPLLLFFVLFKFLNIQWATIGLIFILFGYGLYYLLVRTDEAFGKANRIP